MARSWTRWLIVALALGAALAPGGHLVNGVPLSALGILFLALVAYAAIALPHTRWLSLGFGAVIVLKAIVLMTAPSVGLTASYWARSTPDGRPERSTDFPGLSDATRIDSPLALDLRGEDFAVHFFNDAARFNFGPDVQPGRDQLPFFVRWQGWLLVPSDGIRRIAIDANGSTEVWLDDAQLTATDGLLPLSQGLHTLRIDYARPEAAVPRLTVRWQRDPGGPMVVLSGSDLRWQPGSASTTLPQAVALAADGLDALSLLAWLAFGLRASWRERRLVRPALAAVPLVFLVHGLLLHAPLAGRATILSGLDDWLIYESSARDILLNGWLMDGGQGHAAPFYGQPLYPYVLALAHRLTGESLFGPLALQFAALGVVVASTGVLARQAFGTRLDGLVAVACVWLLLQLEAEHFKVARQLFNENLYMPLVVASLIVTVAAARRGGPIGLLPALGLGALYGLTAISRSQFLLWVACSLVILLLAWRSRPIAAIATLGAVVCGLVLVVAPVTARNAIVSGQFVPISSSGGASLLEFHRPPTGLLDPDALQKDALYNALHLDTQTRTVIAFARADPRGYLATLVPLGAHSLGLAGRNDPGIYWPLFVTVLLYLSAFALQRTRRLHVWPIHGFAATHLVLLMLFEADTYGYRLVMPMYAPMVVVAAQVPLAVVRLLIRSGLGAWSHGGHARRAARFASAGWAALAGLALLLQVRGLAELWPQREPALHGLGGPAAQAALTSDAANAQAIYVASVDGTPRRFGAGSLTGLRYPWFKWFDPARSLPVPAPDNAEVTVVYDLSELAGQQVPGDLVGCLGPPDEHAEVVVGAARVRQTCAANLATATPPIVFDGLARIDASRVPSLSAAGEPLEARLLWQPLVSHPDPQRVSLQLDDPTDSDSGQWGNGTLDLYPARQWQPRELVLSRVPVETDPTALPQTYRVTVGIAGTTANATPATALWQGSRTQRVPLASVTLTPGSGVVGQPLPADIRALEGPPLDGGGLELLGVRRLPAEAAIGGPLKIGLLWRAQHDAPQAAEVTLRLRRSSGEIVQESVVPLFGGRVKASELRAGNVVRDEQTLLIGTRAPAESLSLELAVADSLARLGTIKVTGRAHTFDAAAPAQATFGAAMDLLAASVEPHQARGSDKVAVKVRWRAAAEMPQAYKVFVHVLDPGGQTVVAQRDAEPQDGAAPTTGWVVGEVIDDGYAITLPGSLGAGEYPIEIGVYDPRSGDRLTLADGQNHLMLTTPLSVR